MKLIPVTKVSLIKRNSLFSRRQTAKDLNGRPEKAEKHCNLTMANTKLCHSAVAKFVLTQKAQKDLKLSF